MFSKRTKKVVIFAHSALAIKFFLMEHLISLQRYSHLNVELWFNHKIDGYDEIFSLGTNIVCRHVPVRRKISYLDFYSLLYCIYMVVRFKPSHLINVSPKTGLIGGIAGRCAGVDVITYICQGETFSTLSRLKSILVKNCERLSFFISNYVIFVSCSLKNFLIENNFQISESKKYLIFGSGSICGVDLQAFKPSVQKRKSYRAKNGFPVDSIVLTYVGRMCFDKGLDHLLKVFSDLVVDDDRFYLNLVGPDEGHYLSNLLATVKPEVGAKIVVSGFMNDVSSALNGGDIFVFASFREGLGMAVLEASACGLPVVACQAHGVDDAGVSGHTGFMLDRDVTVWCRIIKKLASDPSLRNAFGANGRERVANHFEKGFVVNMYVRHFVEVLGFAKRE